MISPSLIAALLNYVNSTISNMNMTIASIMLSIDITIIWYPHGMNHSEYMSINTIGPHYTKKLSTLVINSGFISDLYFDSKLAEKKPLFRYFA